MASLADSSASLDCGVLSDGDEPLGAGIGACDGLQGRVEGGAYATSGGGRDDDDVEMGSGGALDLVGGALRALSNLLRCQWKATAEGLGPGGATAASPGGGSKKRKAGAKGWGVGSGAGALLVGEGDDVKKVLLSHPFMGTTLVRVLWDSLTAFFAELDEAGTVERKKNINLYVAGAVEVSCVCFPKPAEDAFGSDAGPMRESVRTFRGAGQAATLSPLSAGSAALLPRLRP